MHTIRKLSQTKGGQEDFTFQMGTLSGNPVAAVAGLKTMEILRRPGAYDTLRRNGQIIMDAMDEHLSATGITHQVVGDPVLFDVMFTPDPVRDYRGVLKGDTAQAASLNRILRDKGIFKSAGKVYPSLALTDDDLSQCVDAIAFAAKHMMN